MNYWLVKTEPETFSWDDLVKKGEDIWDGVRNYQARNNLRKMKKGDGLLFYHSGKNPGIVGLAEVSRENYPDPTANGGDWSVVDIKPVRRLERTITLKEIKENPLLQDMVLVKSSRLSVQPVTKAEYENILKLFL
ncbi:MAG: EVE domain-containing protein [Bacteroidales bacterium]|nr:EVE domain-containing protein [Bacteroidales bacterium]MBN2817389.1 EVE domain-containing protein [Bacteroidales bacterium]